MNNKLVDLNNHLFVEMERLNDESLKGDDLKNEIERARAIAGVAQQILAGGALALRAQEMVGEYCSSGEVQVPCFLLETDHGK